MKNINLTLQITLVWRLKICLRQNSIYENSKNPRNFCLFLNYKLYNENMFTIEIEDGREAP